MTTPPDTPTPNDTPTPPGTPAPPDTPTPNDTPAPPVALTPNDVVPPLDVLAPVTGRTVPLSAVDDPVFATGLVGPGVALVPRPGRESVAVAPVDGTLATVHPHGFVVRADDGRSVLVHLGIDTVELRGEGFVVHRSRGDVVNRGDAVVSWDPAAVEAGGRSAVCPVVALEAAADALAGLHPDGSDLTTSDTLFVWS